MAVLGNSDNISVLIDTKADTKGIDETNKSIDSLEGSSGRGGAALESLGKVARVAAVAVAAAGAAVLTAGISAVKSAGDYEQNRVAFDTMLGSADKARALMTDIANFAKETPFELPEVVTAGKSLLAFGVSAKDIIPTLRQLGDVSAGVGAPVGEIAELYGKAKVQGRLFAEDINQLTGRGIPIIGSLAKVMKVTDGEVKNLVETGKIGFPELEKAFGVMTASGSQFGGMMEKQSHTFNGVVSNLQDGFGQILRSAVGITPAGDIVAGSVFDRIKKAAEGMMPKLQQFTEKVGPAMQDVMRGIGLAFEAARGGDPALWADEGRFVPLVRVLLKVQDVMRSIGGIITSVLGPPFKALIDSVKNDLMPAMKDLGPYFVDLGKILGGVLIGALWLIINGLRLFVQYLAYTINLGKEIREAFIGSFNAISAAIGSLTNWVAQSWRTISSTAEAAWNSVIGVVRVFGQVLTAIFAPFMAVVSYTWGWFSAVTAAAWNIIYSSIIGPVIDWIGDKLRIIVDAMILTWNVFGGAVGQVFGTIRNAFGSAVNWVQSVWGGMVNWFAGIFGQVGNAANGPANAIRNTFASIFEQVKGIVASAINWIITKVNGVVDRVNGVAGKVPGAPKLDRLPAFANGVRNFEGGLALVGEQGPEIVSLARGSNVYTNTESKTMLGSGGGNTFTGDIVLNTAEAVQEFFSKLDRNSELAARGLTTVRS